MPPGWTVALAVGAHAPLVWCPERSISIVLPTSPVAMPWKRRRLRRTAEVRAVIVMPSPVASTLTSPGSVETIELGVDAVSPAPPVAAAPAAGNASEAPRGASATRALIRRVAIGQSILVGGAYEVS